MKRCLMAVLVVLLVLCILAIVYSPFVDLPLTALRPNPAGHHPVSSFFFFPFLLAIHCLLLSFEPRASGKQNRQVFRLISLNHLFCCYIR